MLLRKTMAPLLLCSVMLLTACSGTTPELQTQIREVRQPVPAELLSCTETVTPPAPGYTQRGVAALLSDTYFAWQDCKDKLNAVAGLVTPIDPAKPH